MLAAVRKDETPRLVLSAVLEVDENLVVSVIETVTRRVEKQSKQLVVMIREERESRSRTKDEKRKDVQKGSGSQQVQVLTDWGWSRASAVL